MSQQGNQMERNLIQDDARLQYLKGSSSQQENQLERDLIQDDAISSQSSVLIPHQAQNESKAYQILHMLDIFAFLPVPKTDQVSTKRSICGSLTLLSLFLVYIIYTFVVFLTQNVPRLNQYQIELDPSMNVTAPEIALGYFYGNQLTSEPDYKDLERYFKFEMVQTTKFQNVTKQVPDQKVALTSCKSDDVPWMNVQGYNMLCADSTDSDYFMRGLLYATEVYSYLNIKVTYCNQTNPANNCVNDNELAAKTAGGRIIIFMKKGQMRNFATKSFIDSDINYYSYYYFLIPGFYNRAEIFFGLSQANEYPNYFTTYEHNNVNTLQVSSTNFFVSDVSGNAFATPPNPYAQLSAFQIMFRLDPVVYTTFIDVVSLWGAFWGVLFAMFALYFLRYNQTKFYTKYPDWKRFDNKIKNLQKDSKIETPLKNESHFDDSNDVSNLQHSKVQQSKSNY